MSFTPTFPNRILVHNYEEDTFAIFEQSYTTFANFHTYADGTWNSASYPWNTSNQAWNSAVNQILNPTTIAGNQEGFVFMTSHVGDDTWQGNDYSLMIYDAVIAASVTTITSPQHNLAEGQFIYIVDTQGTTDLNNKVYRVRTIVTDDTFTIELWNGTKYISDLSWTGILTGPGTMRVIDNFDITTKKYNQFLPNARSVRLGYLDFLVQSIGTESLYSGPTIQIDTYIDNDDVSKASITSVMDTYGRANDVLLWQRTFPQSVGSFYTFKLSHPDAFMNAIDDATVTSTFEPFAEIPFELHSLQMHVMPSGRMTR